MKTDTRRTWHARAGAPERNLYCNAASLEALFEGLEPYERLALRALLAHVERIQFLPITPEDVALLDGKAGDGLDIS
jgi:hypothetical protein